MDKYIKILLLFIFAFILAPNSYACYDDWEDDSFDGGWICDYDDIVCTPDDDDDWGNDDWGNDDWDNDDWWYNDDPNDDWWNDDATWENDLWDNDDDSYTGQNHEIYISTLPTASLDQATTLCLPKDSLKAVFVRQEHRGTCIPAGLTYVAKIFGDTAITERKIDSMVVIVTKSVDFLRLGMLTTNETGHKLKGYAKSLGLDDSCVVPDTIKNILDINDAINKGYAVMTSIKINETSKEIVYHNVVIVGFNNNEYIAWDTGAGRYIAILPDKLANIYCTAIKK